MPDSAGKNETNNEYSKLLSSTEDHQSLTNRNSKCKDEQGQSVIKQPEPDQAKGCCHRFTSSFSFTARQWKTLVILALINLGEAVIVSLQAPFFPAEAESKGATATEYGLVFGVFELVIFIVSPFYGKYMMKIGPKFLLNSGILTTSICCILFGFLDRIYDRNTFIAFAFIVRIFQALGEAGYITASFSLIAQEFPESIATTFASLETCFGIGILMGPTIGGALYQAGGYVLPFTVMGSFLFVGVCITFFFLPNPDTESMQDSETLSVIDALKIVPVSISVFTTFCGACAIGYLSATLEPHLRQFNLSPVQNGAMFIITGGVYALTAPVWGRLCDKYKQTKVFVAIAAINTCIAYTLLGPAPYLPFNTILWVCIVALVFNGLGVGGEIVCAFIGSLKEAIKHGYSDDMRTYGLISALWSSAFAFGAFVGPSVGGLMLDTVGFRNGTLFIIIEHAFLFVLVVSFLLHRKYLSPVVEPERRFSESRYHDSIPVMSSV
ncbi:hypothetical protein CHUAL_002066 [Chamberlinius hualienensis]